MNTPPVTIEERLIIKTVNQALEEGIKCKEIYSLYGQGEDFQMILVKNNVKEQLTRYQIGTDNVLLVSDNFYINLFLKERFVIVCQKETF